MKVNDYGMSIEEGRRLYDFIMKDSEQSNLQIKELKNLKKELLRIKRAYGKRKEMNMEELVHQVR